MSVMVSPRHERLGVLFISSAENPGADTFIHMLVMRHLDRQEFDVHVACSAGPPTARTDGYRALAAIPAIHLVEANFGPSLSEQTLAGKLLRALSLPAALVGFLNLARYI